MYEHKCYTVTPFLQYDGTNADEIFTAGSDGQDGTWTYNEDNDILTIRCTYDPEVFEEWAAPVDGCFLFRPNGGVSQALTNSEFTDNYAVVLEALNPPVENSFGIEAVGTVNDLGATVTRNVELKPAMPNTSYHVAAVISGGANLLANLEVVSETIVDESNVSVVVRNNGLTASTGGKIVVTAVN